MEQIYLNGVGVYPFTSEQELLEYIDQRGGVLVALNAEKIIHATDHTRALINRNIGYCDGAGAMLAIRQKGAHNAIKIAGCELWLQIVERFYRDKSFYLVGAKPKVIEDVICRLLAEFPSINIVGYRDGYLRSEQERDRLIDDIVEKRPDVIFVAMGSPAQELLLEDIQARHTAIYQGLGGSFDIYAGRVKRAPRWWIDHNLEFAYRLLREPRRIVRQIHLVRFAYWLLTKRL